jgi:hypothetical protein
VGGVADHAEIKGSERKVVEAIYNDYCYFVMAIEQKARRLGRGACSSKLTVLLLQWWATAVPVLERSRHTNVTLAERRRGERPMHERPYGIGLPRVWLTSGGAVV